MSYVTPDDVRAVLSADGTATPGSASSFDDVALQTQIDEAQADVDARLAVRYSTPWSDQEVPVLVAHITRDLAAWLATLVQFQGVPIEPTHPVQLRYNRAMGQLRGLTDGSITLTLPNLPDDQQPVENVQGAGSVVNPYGGRMFSPEQLGIGWDLQGQRAVDPFGAGW